jgi:hypothetical protein
VENQHQLPLTPLVQILKLRLGEVGPGQIRAARQNIRLRLRQALQCLVAEAQVVLDGLLGSQAEPLSDRDVVVDRGLEDLCNKKKPSSATVQQREVHQPTTIKFKPTDTKPNPHPWYSRDNARSY